MAFLRVNTRPGLETRHSAWTSHCVVWAVPVKVFFGKRTVQLPRCLMARRGASLWLNFLPNAHLKNPSEED